MPIIILFVALALVSCSTTPAPQAEAPVSVASVKCKVGSELKPGDKCTGKTQDGEDYVFVNKDGELRWGGSYIKKGSVAVASSIPVEHLMGFRWGSSRMAIYS